MVDAKVPRRIKNRAKLNCSRRSNHIYLNGGVGDIWMGLKWYHLYKPVARKPWLAVYLAHAGCPQAGGLRCSWVMCIPSGVEAFRVPSAGGVGLGNSSADWRELAGANLCSRALAWVDRSGSELGIWGPAVFKNKGAGVTPVSTSNPPPPALGIGHGNKKIMCKGACCPFTWGLWPGVRFPVGFCHVFSFVCWKDFEAASSGGEDKGSGGAGQRGWGDVWMDCVCRNGTL